MHADGAAARASARLIRFGDLISASEGHAGFRPICVHRLTPANHAIASRFAGEPCRIGSRWEQGNVGPVGSKVTIHAEYDRGPRSTAQSACLLPGQSGASPLRDAQRPSIGLHGKIVTVLRATQAAPDANRRQRESERRGRPLSGPVRCLSRNACARFRAARWQPPRPRDKGRLTARKDRPAPRR
jgi:hypothetical protein